MPIFYSWLNIEAVFLDESQPNLIIGVMIYSWNSVPHSDVMITSSQLICFTDFNENTTFLQLVNIEAVFLDESEPNLV